MAKRGAHTSAAQPGEETGQTGPALQEGQAGERTGQTTLPLPQAKEEPTPPDKPTRRPRTKREAREVFAAATPRAAAFLVAVMEDETASFSARMDAAKTILDRVYGRSTPLPGESEGKVEIVMDAAVRELLG